MDKNISRNSHEPNFNRELKTVSRDHRIAVPSAHTHIRSVFSSVIESQIVAPKVQSVAVHDVPTKSASTTFAKSAQHFAKSSVSAPKKVDVSPVHAAPSHVHAPKMVRLDNMTVSQSQSVAPSPKELQVVAPTEFAKLIEQTESVAPTNFANIESFDEAQDAFAEADFILDEPELSAAFRENYEQPTIAPPHIATPISFAEALAQTEAPALDLFAPNAVDPVEAKMSEKKSALSRAKDLAKNKKQLREKLAAKKADFAKKRADKSSAKAEHDKVRENLLAAQNADDEGGMNLNDNFANGLMAAAADTNDDFAKNPELPATETGVIAKAQPRFVLNVAGKDFAIGTNMPKFAKPNVKFAMPKVNGRKVIGALRIAAIVVILSVSGYLAWDTWMTNRDVQSSFTSAEGAMSITTADPSSADPTAVSSQQYSGYTTPADEPRYITINSIGVNARVQKVGVTSSGNIDVPKKLADTAWYDGSAKPGQAGEVFIDGHTSFSSTPSSFNDLPKVKAGDEITVQTGNGTNYTYKIASAEAVPTAQVDMSKALNTPAGATKGLTLMTCTGKYNYQTHDASERFVVYAVQE